MLGASLGDLGCACLIMELVAGGDLASHIHDRHKRRLTYIEILQVLVFIGFQILQRTHKSWHCTCCFDQLRKSDALADQLPALTCVRHDLVTFTRHSESSDSPEDHLRLASCQLLENWLRQVAHDVAAGLAYLHPAVVHRDLKPQNILLEGCGADGGGLRAKVLSATDHSASQFRRPITAHLDFGLMEHLPASTGLATYTSRVALLGVKCLWTKERKNERGDKTGCFLNELAIFCPQWICR